MLVSVHPRDRALNPAPSMFYSAVLRPLSLTEELVRRLTSCHWKLLPAPVALSMELLDKALFRAIAGGGKCSVFSGSAGALSGWLSPQSCSRSPAGQLTDEHCCKRVEEAFTWRATPLLQSLQMESKWHNAPHCCIKEISPLLVKLGA